MARLFHSRNFGGLARLVTDTNALLQCAIVTQMLDMGYEPTPGSRPAPGTASTTCGGQPPGPPAASPSPGSGSGVAGEEGEDGAAGDAEAEGDAARGVGGDRGPEAGGPQCLRGSGGAE